jgi:hypothetical protein
MKRILFSAALSAALACLSLPVRAESLAATVPFGFYMDKAAMPAGDYRVEIEPRGLVIVRNTTGRAAFTLTLPDQRKADGPQKGLLVFHKIGGEYFLNQVWVPNSPRGRQLRTSAREKEAYARTSGVVVASIPARQE